jgi:WD40 repeat protein
VALIGLVLAPPAQGAEPPAEPVLRIEAGQHAAPIRRHDVDAAGRTLVTGSYDKTARVWSLPRGRLERVLRPPIGPGNEGKVYAVAISPDGNAVAVGGWTGYEWDRKNSIYLFARSSGRLTRRLGGLENVIQHLAFSPDGRHLAAGLGRGNGVRVWRLGDGALVLADRDYGGASYGLAFDRTGRLATTSEDGHVRLYSDRFKLVTKEKAPGGEPFGIAFSPDGARLAVGYDDTTAVSVLSGRDLNLLYAPDIAGVDNGNFYGVAWSADGRYLFAGGRYARQGSHPIRRWAEGGRGPAIELAASQNTVMSLRPYGPGGVLFAAHDPRFGAFDGAGAELLSVGPETPDLRGKRGEHFTLSRDGSSVRFGLGQGGKRPVRFDLLDRRLLADAPAASDLAVPRTVAPGLAVAGWKDTPEPTLNGKPLKLMRYEPSRSLAVAPDGRNFLLGSEWGLRLYDAAGEELWRRPVPGVVWWVNASGDGRLAVAAYGDGTVRWHRLADGAELLALFVHPDAKRWVAWTPQGYYDAAPGAEDLIGWHVNNGKDQAADFFGAGRFRDTFYRPDVVARVLDTLDEAEALTAADAAGKRRHVAEVELRRRLPPVVTILAPADGASVSSRTVELRYAVRSPSGLPVTAVRVLVDGRPLDAARALKRVAAGRDGAGDRGHAEAEALRAGGGDQRL